MRKILFYISIFFFILMPITADAAWYSASWTYRVKITVDNTKVDADLTDFPVYVNLADLSSDFHTNVKSDGCDIRVTSSDGSTEVPIDLVFYTAASDTGELHFKASSLANSTDTVFYIYYGNSGTSCPSASATYGRNNVWINYEVVMHGQEDPTGTVTNSVGSNNGTGNSVESGDLVATHIGKGYQFDGTGESVSFPNATLTSVLSNDRLTVSAWVKFDSGVATYDNIWGATNGDGWSDGFGAQSAGTDLKFWVSDWAGNTADMDTSISTAVYRYYTGVYDGSNVIAYKNGASNASDPYAGTITDTTSAVHIGRVPNGNDNYAAPGYYDEFRISDSVLSATWISTEYNNQSSPSTFYSDGAQESNSRRLTLKRPPNNFLGLVARYTFDGGDMTSNVADSSGTGNNGYLSGQTSTTTAIGKIGQALSFDGSNDSLSESAIDLSGTNALSVSLWMRKVSFGAGTDKVLFEVTTNTNNNTTGLFFTAEPSLGGGSTCTAGSQPLMAIALKGDVGYDAHCYTAPSVNEWHHYVALYDKGQAGGSETSLYIDGVLQTPTGTANSCCSNNTNNFGNDPWYIMSRAGSTLFNDGSLDDFRIYSRALTATEVKQIYNSAQSKISKTPTGISSGLVGHWSFDGNKMTSNIADSSGNGNHGYLVGVTSTTTKIGKMGQAFRSSGATNAGIDVPHSSSIAVAGPSITISSWVYLDSTPTAEVDWIGKWNLAGNVRSYFQGSHYAASFARILCGISSDGGTTNWHLQRTVSAHLTVGWQHVVCAYNGTSWTIYYNGSSVAVENDLGSAQSSIYTGGSESLHISYLPTTSFTGALDDMRVYNRTLSASEVDVLYRLGQTKVRP